MFLSEEKKTKRRFRDHKLFHSVFFKMFLILVIGGICINLLVESLFRGAWDVRREIFVQNLSYYTHFLIKDLGSPPDFQKAKSISQQLAINIRYESPDVNWTTSESVPHVDQISIVRYWKLVPNLEAGRFDGRYFIFVKEDEGSFVFGISHLEHGHIRNRYFWLSLLLVTVVLVLIYFAIRRVLKPLKSLSEGVRQLSEGNLNYQIQSPRKDELGALARAFDGMTHRIKDMIQSKEQLLLDVSHEFRSPLTRIKVALEFLKEDPTRTMIREDVDELEKMVTEILETARLGSAHGHLEMQPIDLIQVLKLVEQTHLHHFPGMDYSALPDSVMIRGDLDRIRIVINNLLTNAIKYSSADDKQVQVAIEQTPESIVLQITNRGDGIPEEELPFIFEPFYRVDKSRSKKTGGYGLGLHLCKKIMEAHQGKITVQSDSQTTTFSLYFPIIEGP